VCQRLIESLGPWRALEAAKHAGHRLKSAKTRLFEALLLDLRLQHSYYRESTRVHSFLLAGTQVTRIRKVSCFRMTAFSAVAYKSPLHQMTETTPTRLWNDSASMSELAYSIEHGAVGATCNPVIAVGILKKEMPVWKSRITELVSQFPEATESDIGWRVVEKMSIKAAALLDTIFHKEKGRNGRLSIQTDPRFFKNSTAIVEQARRFDKLASNMIVKIPATCAGIAAMEEATYEGISINATVSFTVPQCIAVAEAVERGLRRRDIEGKDISTMGPVCTIVVGRLDDWLKVVTEKARLCVDPGYLEWAGVAVFKKAYILCTGASL
jgi:transaldolase